MNSKVFDVLKWVAMVFFPAAVTCTITILTALGYENTNVIAIVLGAIETFLGSILGVSSITYYKKASEIEIEEIDWEKWNEVDDGK